MKSPLASQKQKTAAWLQTLKNLGVDTRKLSFAELKPFKDVDRYLNAPVQGPAEIQYLVTHYRKLAVFGHFLIAENKYPALNRCWDELESLFMNDPAFEDGVFVQAWIFIDFPLDPQGTTVLDLYAAAMQGNEAFNQAIGPFVQSMGNSRLGLYQEVLGTRNRIRFIELISGDKVSVENSIVEYQKGEVFLIRIVHIADRAFIFGDPKTWPGIYRDQLESMVENKLFYFDAPTKKGQYEKFMKYAGPYWFSCVATDKGIPILDPDHYKYY
jgi:hypothetical protein